MKRKLQLKDDDEDLVNQKTVRPSVELKLHGAPADRSKQQKKRPPEVLTTNKNANIVPPRPSAKPSLVSEELRTLESVQAEREMNILADIKQNIAKHARWNEGYVDWTTVPFTPTSERDVSTSFRPAITTEYLPTPPSSESSESRLAVSSDRNSSMADIRNNMGFMRQPTPPSEELLTKRMPCFRRRIGRGGRVMIDRRNIPFKDRTDLNPITLERFKYDHDEDLEEPIYEHDPYDVRIMQHRTYLTTRSRDQAAAAAASQAQLQNHIIGPSQAQANYMQAQLAQLQQGPGSAQLQAKLAQRQILNERLNRAVAVKPSP